MALSDQHGNGHGCQVHCLRSDANGHTPARLATQIHLIKPSPGPFFFFYSDPNTTITMSEPTVVPSSNPLPTTASANGTATPVVISRGGASGGSGTFGVKTGLAQMLKGGCVYFDNEV